MCYALGVIAIDQDGSVHAGYLEAAEATWATQDPEATCASCPRPSSTTAIVIPGARCRNAPAAIDWPGCTLGFERHKDEDYGARDFSCRDLEGHIWNFGHYDPW